MTCIMYHRYDAFCPRRRNGETGPRGQNRRRGRANGLLGASDFAHPTGCGNRHEKETLMKTLLHMPAFVAASLLAAAIAPPAAAEDYDHVLRLDHYVGVRSTVPAIAGQTTPIYVREVVRAASALRDRNVANRVV